MHTKSIGTAKRSILKLAKLQNLVAKCCKMRKIQPCKICKFCMYFVLGRGPLGQNVAKNAFSWHRSGEHLVCVYLKDI